MYVTKSINANHEDLIHDVAYDFYGKRMATCSSDQKVKVWDQQENGEWVCSARSWTQSKTISSARLGPRKKYRLLSLRIKYHFDFSWKSHYGSVWKVNWAHPEFGQVKKEKRGRQS